LKKIKMWAYWDAKKETYFHLYKSERLVRMCSPDGYEKYEKEGHGKVVPVWVVAEDSGLET